MALPIADDELLYSISEDSILKVNSANGVLVGDTDADGDALAARVTSLPFNPLFNLRTNGAFTYDARYHGTLYLDTDGGANRLSNAGDAEFTLTNGFDSLAAGAVIYDYFNYVANDGVNDSAPALVKITIIGVNDAPIAEDDISAVVAGGGNININVLANDHDVDIWPTADTLTITSFTDISDDGGPAGGSGLNIVTDAGGTVTLVGGQIHYVAAANFFGIDTFTYTVNDGNGGTDTGLDRVTVLPANATPDAVDDTRTIGEDAGATSFLTVLGNDTDTNDSPLIAADLVLSLGTALRRVDENGVTITGDTGVLVDFNSDGTFTYNPSGDFETLAVGESAYVAFDYTAYDGMGANDTATVIIEIQGANDAPSGETPDNAVVYEAGLATGSGDGTTTIVRDIDITMFDPDGSDMPFIAGSTGGLRTSIAGDYGTLTFLDDDTVRYTLTDNADHTTVQGHNGGIFDTFDIYAVDENGGFSAAIQVTIEVIDDINFLAVLPNGEAGANTVDDKSVTYADAATVTDSFTLIAGADGQSLDVVGIPDEFTLVDGRTVTSEVYTDGNGNEAVRGTDSEGDTFYELVFDPEAGTDLGSYTLTMFQGPPTVINDLDFSALGAGGPKEYPFIDNIGFNGGFFTDGADIEGTFTDPGSGTNADDINPNNAGGIGIGNGNIELNEALVVDVTQSSGDVSSLQLDVEGVGGGIGIGDILWEAYAADGTTKIDSGFITVNLTSTTGAHTIEITPDNDFAFLYIALDPNDFDSNDKMRINRIATVEQIDADDILLGFRINSDDGDGDQSPATYEEFVVTVNGAGTGTIDPGILVA